MDGVGIAIELRIGVDVLLSAIMYWSSGAMLEHCALASCGYACDQAPRAKLPSTIALAIFRLIDFLLCKGEAKPVISYRFIFDQPSQKTSVCPRAGDRAVQARRSARPSAFPSFVRRCMFE